MCTALSTAPPRPAAPGSEETIMSSPLTPLPGWRGGDGNAAYLDKTLTHWATEEYFDESVTFRTIRQLWFRATAGSILVFMVMSIFILIGGSIGFVFALLGSIGAWW